MNIIFALILGNIFERSAIVKSDVINGGRELRITISNVSPHKITFYDDALKLLDIVIIKTIRRSSRSKGQPKVAVISGVYDHLFKDLNPKASVSETFLTSDMFSEFVNGEYIVTISYTDSYVNLRSKEMRLSKISTVDKTNLGTFRIVKSKSFSKISRISR